MNQHLLKTLLLSGLIAITNLAHADNFPRQTVVPAAELQQAFRDHRDGLITEGEGVVTKILGDDNTGSRHQRFIIRLQNGLTLLIAHNVDLARRIPGLNPGDRVRFHGQYEWNDKGGVVHWTHHDPDNRHPAGWLEHLGVRYQ